MPIELRLATPADIPLIRALADKIWWAHYPSIISDAQIAYMLDMMYSETELARQMTEGQTFRLVLADGQPLGFVAVSQLAEGSFFLHKFYLDTAQHGRGTGSEAFRQLLAALPADLREMRLRVNRRNFKSVNFYFKVGFVIEFCVDTPFGPDYVMDDFQMLWKRR